MIIEPIESILEISALDQTFFDGNSGLDVEAKEILKALFCKDRTIRVFDYCGDLPSGEEGVIWL